MGYRRSEVARANADIAHPSISQTLVIVWISSDDAKAIAEAGYNIIHAPVTNFYLDVGMGGWIGNVSLAFPG